MYRFISVLYTGTPETTKGRGSLVLEGNQWRSGRRQPPKILGCRKIFLSEIFRRKMQTLKLKKIFWGKFRVKVEILSTHGLLCRTFAAVCVNSVGNFQ